MLTAIPFSANETRKLKNYFTIGEGGGGGSRENRKGTGKHADGQKAR